MHVLQQLTVLIALTLNTILIKCYEFETSRLSSLYGVGTYLVESIASHISINNTYRIYCWKKLFSEPLSSNVFSESKPE
jgi:hypothetical protein